MVEAAGLEKSFGPAPALNGFDLTVARGSVCALLRLNGAGKTTAIRFSSRCAPPATPAAKSS
jgi:ABC-2 type transport system ATP-binding protein